MLGRDVLSRLLYGARVSLWVGFVSVSISIAIGIALGLLAGYFRGIVDESSCAASMSCSASLLFPYPCRYCVFRTKPQYDYGSHRADLMDGGGPVGPRGNPLPARTGFCRAARLAGTRPFRIMVMHILPNALTPVLVSATLGIAGAILVESSLSFLGLGVQPPDPVGETC